ncbi:hypothetical protein NDU88_010471 [Pleurodeles waltl]|uniref:Uncharacterized protein n=1 Tax=Pleurodeles waltl TaxID=8319 RepID=A0AAV7PY67_PLEWA|nr:hypothetical protein NDU88_010471 [Pleurodeles waltl]
MVVLSTARSDRTPWSAPRAWSAVECAHGATSGTYFGASPSQPQEKTSESQEPCSGLSDSSANALHTGDCGGISRPRVNKRVTERLRQDSEQGDSSRKAPLPTAVAHDQEGDLIGRSPPFPLGPLFAFEARGREYSSEVPVIAGHPHPQLAFGGI